MSDPTPNAIRRNVHPVAESIFRKSYEPADAAPPRRPRRQVNTGVYGY
jgi:hypothetical protein